MDDSAAAAAGGLPVRCCCCCCCCLLFESAHVQSWGGFEGGDALYNNPISLLRSLSLSLLLLDIIIPIETHTDAHERVRPFDETTTTKNNRKFRTPQRERDVLGPKSPKDTNTTSRDTKL